MKASISSLVCLALMGLAVQSHAAESPQEAPSSVIDRLTLIYLDHKIYPAGAVECEPKVVGARSMIGCSNVTLNGTSMPHLWLYESGKIKSINGKARQLAEGTFANEPEISVMPLPLPADIDVGATLSAFTKG
ncbi:hypothetical protein HU749_006925 [Pseudomonas ogarae]|uniref:hypothetical protein n=1 Tax=Pseudomonas ogarae (strain DSM 112162 / CECT 30235 / F113) TaxID=1114970 RepID=UPI0016495FB3|nr:hypothetical protein [Pseudomonas zarinae]QXH96114.1 hypothetical protein HU749_006925 [Pseudomonas zarinae]